MRAGVALLRERADLRRAFVGMNSAMARSSRGRYDRWRPFQIGFLLANISCLTDPALESETADVVWFATGGGKTETYLGLVVTAALFDRMRGKKSGITAWSRFPLRMLSPSTDSALCRCHCCCRTGSERDGPRRRSVFSGLLGWTSGNSELDQARTWPRRAGCGRSSDARQVPSFSCTLSILRK